MTAKPGLTPTDYRQAYNAVIHTLAELRGIYKRLADERAETAARIVARMIDELDAGIHALAELPRS